MKTLRWTLTVLLGPAMLASLYLDFIYSPPEAKMGNVVRILYFHVASAVDAFTGFGVCALLALVYLLTRRLFWERLAAASALVGLVFTTLVLISGSLWGAAVWNTWWTWDPTLTTTLILWFLYAGYMLLRASIADRRRSAAVASVYGIVAALDVPLIHESAKWWSGLHPSVITDAGFNMPPSMTVTLLASFAVFLGVYALLFWMAARLAEDGARVAELRERLRLHMARVEGGR